MNMSKPIKMILVSAGGLIGLLVLVAAALLLFVDANAYKPRLEAAASAALGMEVTVQGPLGIRFFPGLRITLQDVQVRNRGGAVAAAAEVRLGVEFFPLLRKEIRVGSIAVKRADISIEQDREGHFNIGRTAADSDLPELELAKVSLADGIFRFTDQHSGAGIEARDCSLELRHLRLSPGKQSDLLKHLSCNAELACGELRKDDFSAADLRVSAEVTDGIFELQPVTMQLFGAQGTGSIHADLSSAVPHYAVRYSLPRFPIEAFFKRLTPGKVAAGTMDFNLQLSLQGTTLKALRQTLAGQISLRGENLILDGRDLDEEFSRHESSQNFNLMDVGAIFLAGPFGLAVTKGYNFASNLQGPEGTSVISSLVSNWQVKHGVAQARDVAMATKEHRVALQGRLDFVNERFDEVTLALIDARGCARVRQKISGSFQQPVVEQPSIPASLAGPVVKLFRKGMALFSEDECEAFYTGSVAPP